MRLDLRKKGHPEEVEAAGAEAAIVGDCSFHFASLNTGQPVGAVPSPDWVRFFSLSKVLPLSKEKQRTKELVRSILMEPSEHWNGACGFKWRKQHW
jgi:hypothetical protein